MADGYYMYEWSSDGKELLVDCDSLGRWPLIQWREEHFGRVPLEPYSQDWIWGWVMGPMNSTIFQFLDLENSMAFKLRWYDERVQRNR